MVSILESKCTAGSEKYCGWVSIRSPKRGNQNWHIYLWTKMISNGIQIVFWYTEKSQWTPDIFAKWNFILTKRYPTKISAGMLKSVQHMSILLLDELLFLLHNSYSKPWDWGKCRKVSYIFLRSFQIASYSATVFMLHGHWYIRTFAHSNFLMKKSSCAKRKTRINDGSVNVSYTEFIIRKISSLYYEDYDHEDKMSYVCQW